MLREAPGALYQIELIYCIPPWATQESAPSALIWRLWRHSSKSWGGKKVSSEPRNAQIPNPRRHSGTKYLLLTVHCSPSLNNRNQFHSLLAVLPGLFQFSPGKQHSTQPTLNAASSVTLKQTQSSSSSKGVSRCPISGTKSRADVTTPSGRAQRNRQFLVFLAHRLLQYCRRIAEYQKLPAFSNSSYFLWCKSLGKSTHSRKENKKKQTTPKNLLEPQRLQGNSTAMHCQ